MRRVRFGGSLLYALIFGKLFIFVKTVFFGKIYFGSYALANLRAGRSVTRLTVYWAFSLKKPAGVQNPEITEDLSLGCLFCQAELSFFRLSACSLKLDWTSSGRVLLLNGRSDDI